MASTLRFTTFRSISFFPFSFSLSFSFIFFFSYPFSFFFSYFKKVLEEVRKHKKGKSRNIDTINFKLQKPISKDDSKKVNKVKKKKKKKWWKNALFFFKKSWSGHNSNDHHHQDVHQARAQAFRASISGPVYKTESKCGSRPSSVDIPYLSLRELSMEHKQQQNISSPTMPIYLIT